MRWLRSFILATAFLLMAANATAASAGRIVKVLPHYLDKQGRQSLSPSLYERDAYQDQLRKNPADCSGLRFDVQWRARGANAAQLKLRVEVRTGKGMLTKVHTLEQTGLKKGWFGNRGAVNFDRAVFTESGEIIAWRVTLWNGEEQLSEQKSFLW
jgi:hypothetical protein